MNAENCKSQRTARVREPQELENRKSHRLLLMRKKIRKMKKEVPANSHVIST